MSLAEYLKDKRVVVVGPAPSIIGSGQGQLIDSYDVVVRINKALPVPSKLAKDIGTRTNILYNCLNTGEDCGGKIFLSYLDSIDWLVCPYPPIHPFDNDISRFLKINNEQVKFSHIDTRYYIDVANQMGTRPNSGIGTILDLLCYPIKELYITGFTFFKGGYYKEYRPLNEAQVMNYMGRYGNHSQSEQIEFMKNVLLNDDRVKMDDALSEIILN